MCNRSIRGNHLAYAATQGIIDRYHNIFVYSCIYIRLEFFLFPTKGTSVTGCDSIFGRFIIFNVTSFRLYPEWPHRQCVGLAFRRSRFYVSLAAAGLAICAPHLYRAIRRAMVLLPCVYGGRNGQSIETTVSDVVVRNWLWSSVTGSSPLGYFDRLLQVVDNWPHIPW